MSRIVQVNDSDYKIKVRSNGLENSNGTVTLDVGDRTGRVIVTGDLLVYGQTTTVESTNVTITDPIIVINNQLGVDGQPAGNGISTPTKEAGIEIGRGVFPPARLFFDENLWWYDNQTNSNKQGAFIFKTGALLSGIRTNSITTNNKDQNLNLLGPSPRPGESGTGTAVISVKGVTNYAQRINNKLLVDQNQAAYEESIPNVAWVNTALTNYFETNSPQFIKRGDSVLRIFDTSESDVESKLELKLNDVVNATYRISNFTVQDFRFSNGTIETLTAGNDLVLRSSGSGSVTVDDNLKITLTVQDPAQVAGSIKLYTKQESYGGTGIYFVNNSNTRDEIMSRRKALAYSMIF
jgi:hypothetical protein